MIDFLSFGAWKRGSSSVPQFGYNLLWFSAIALLFAASFMWSYDVDVHRYLFLSDVFVSAFCFCCLFVMRLRRYTRVYATVLAEMTATFYVFTLIVCSGLYHLELEVTYVSLCTFLTVFAMFSSKRSMDLHLILNFSAIVVVCFLCRDVAKIDVLRFVFLVFCFCVPIYMAFSNRISTQQSYEINKSSLIQSEERFQNIFENAPIGIVLLDREYNIVRINKRLAAISGYTDEMLFEISPMSLVHPDDRLPPEVILQKVLQSPVKYFSSEVRMIRKNQEVSWLRLTATCIDIDGEMNSHMLLMLEDINLQKKSEEKLRAYAEQLSNQYKALEEFSYVISHDLQEPLRMITVYTQLLQQRYISKIPDADAQTNMGFVIEGAKRMSQLIKDMLEYSRWTTKDMPKELVGTNEVLVEVIKNLTIAMKYSQASIKSQALPPLHTNRMLLGQVLQNIIGNSLKYAHPDRSPVITITSDMNDTDTIIYIEDNGIGFDIKDRDRIFGIFQRLHGRQSQYQGNGIGLAICKRIIEKQGGKIWAEGQLGEGAKFCFSVPNT